MILLHRKPGRALSGIVSELWVVRTDDYPYPRETMLPEGGPVVMFNLGPELGIVDGESGRVEPVRKAWAAGERTGPLTVEARSGYDVVGVRFRPGAARPFLGAPLDELTDRVVELDDLGRRAWLDTRERLRDVTTPEDRLRILENELLRRFPGVPAPDGLVMAAVRRLSRGPVTPSVRGTARELGVSHRFLVERFRRDVGVPPKLLQRILRLQRAVALEDEHPEWDWSRIAGASGYYDQAHLIRDFRILGRLTPGEYRRRRAEWANYVPGG